MAHPGGVIEHPITGERITFLKTSAQTEGKLLQIELAVAPNGFVSGEHLHPFQEETFQIVSGVLDFVVDGTSFQAGAGERVVVPAGTLHTWKNGGAEEVVAVLDFVPALNAEECFESSFGLAQDGKVDPTTGVPDQPWLALLLLRYRDFAQIPGLPLTDLLNLFTPTAEEAERNGFRMPYPYPYNRSTALEPRAA